MAITNIFGFQNFSDIPMSSIFTDFTPLGKLPFINNVYEYSDNNVPSDYRPLDTKTGFSFVQYYDRMWLRTQWGGQTRYSPSNSGGYGNTRFAYNYARQPRFLLPIDHVFTGQLDDVTNQRFIMGFRYKVINATQISNYPCYFGPKIVAEGLSSTTYNTFLSKDEVPSVGGAEIYVEIEIDFEERTLRRWIDSVRQSDQTLHGSVTRTNFSLMMIFWGDKQSSTTPKVYDTHFALNDFYFMVDTSHREDGLPSKRLGPIEVEALEIDKVTLPETWENSASITPEALLTQSQTTTNARDVNGLLSDSGGEKATVSFKTPEIKDGEIIYAELDLYGYREYGDHVAINTQMKVGEEEAEEQQFTLLPETLRTGTEAIYPAKFHQTPEGNPLSEEVIGQLTLDVWSSKPE